MKTYIQPQIVIDYLATSYAICYSISSDGKISGFGEPGGGGGPH